MTNILLLLSHWLYPTCILEIMPREAKRTLFTDSGHSGVALVEMSLGGKILFPNPVFATMLFSYSGDWTNKSKGCLWSERSLLCGLGWQIPFRRLSISCFGIISVTDRGRAIWPKFSNSRHWECLVKCPNHSAFPVSGLSHQQCKATLFSGSGHWTHDSVVRTPPGSNIVITDSTFPVSALSM